MVELHRSLGFNTNPFSSFSAEEETKYITDIYINPKYYNTLFGDLMQGRSRFIIGSRGSGKTALILSLFNSLQSDSTICIMFDTFDGIPVANNEKQIIYNVVQKIVLQYSLCLANHPRLLKKLNRFELEKLAFLIEQFFITISRREYENEINRITKYKRKNFIKQIWNSIFNKPINFAISGSVEIASDIVSRSLGLPKVDSSDFFKNYLPEARLTKPSQTLKLEDFDYNALKEILSDLCSIIKKSGYLNVVVFFDKIDEFKTLNGSINNIASFIESIVKDTQLLMNNDFSLVFSIWDEVKDELNSRGVRFDKFQPIDVTWNLEDLKTILNKRINYFSSGKLVVNNILEDKNSIDEILQLAFRSPRDMIHIFSNIYQEQDSISSDSKKFLTCAVERGKLKFCKDYDYYSVYPSKRGSKADVTININRILRIKKKILRTTDFVNTFKVSTPTAISYISILLNYNFVKELPEKVGNAPQYEVIDPKISYLIDNGINEL